MSKLFGSLLVAALAVGTIASPVAEPAMPAITEAPSLAKRATSCTFSGSSGAASASKSQASCSTIILSNVAVPSGTTLDLSKLADDTTVSFFPFPIFQPCQAMLTLHSKVIFEGETTWGYEEWSGPLLQISGTGITVKGASGAYLNPDGARWWDGEGSNGGKTKPKFFYAHDLTDSTITDLYIYNTPVQAVSINGCDGLTITDMTINSEAGDSAGGHNTDGFDIGSSSNVVITGANVYNQDDCVAVNSGTVRIRRNFRVALAHLTDFVNRISLSAAVSALVATVCLLVASVVEATTPWTRSHSQTPRLRTR